MSAALSAAASGSGGGGGGGGGGGDVKRAAAKEPPHPSKKRAKKVTRLVDVRETIGEKCGDEDCEQTCGPNARPRLRVIGELVVAHPALAGQSFRAAQRIGEFVGFEGLPWHACDACTEPLCHK